MRQARKPATLLKRITEGLAIIRSKVDEDESLLRGMLPILVAEGKRDADKLRRRMNRDSPDSVSHRR